MDNINSLLKRYQIDISLPKKLFKSRNGDLYIFTTNNMSSPENRYYQYDIERSRVLRINQLKFKNNVNLKNELVLCTEEEFIKQIYKNKMMTELIR